MEIRPILQKQNDLSVQQFKEDHKETLQPSNLIKQYNLFAFTYAIFPMLLAIISFFITSKFYDARKPEREKVMDDICKLSEKLAK